MTQRSLGKLVVQTGVDRSGLTADLTQLRRDLASQAIGVGVRLDLGDAGALKGLRQEIANLAGVSQQALGQQAAAARALRAEQVALTASVKAQSAATVAASNEARAQHQAELAAIRLKSAALALSARQMAQDRREEKQAADALLHSLDNQQRSWRNLAQAGQVGKADLIQMQEQIRQKALAATAGLDAESDAYRRLTQVAAAAQRTIDQANGRNTFGGFGAGVTNGILNALGSLGPFGGALESIIRAQMQRAEATAKAGGAGVGRAAGQGVAAGMASETPAARAAADLLARGVTQAVADELEVRSPSRVMARIGQWVAGGLALGMRQGKAESDLAARQLAAGIEQNARPRLSGGGVGGAASVPVNDEAALARVAGNAALATAAVGATVVAVGALAAAFVSLAKTGLDQTKIIQNAFAVLKNNGENDLAGVSAALDRLKQSGNDAAESFSKADLAAALADTVKAGASTAESLNLMAVSTRFAAQEGTNLTEQTGMLLKAIRQYNLETTDAAQVGDKFAKAGNLAAGTATDLFKGFNVVAGTAFQAKLSMSDLLGMLIELDNRGMDAADVGANGLRAALAALADVTPKARDQLKEWNIALEDNNGRARPAGDIIKDLSAKLADLGISYDRSTGELVGNGDALRAVSTIMDTRAAAAVLNLKGDWKKYSDEVKNSTGTLRDNDKAFSETLERQQAKLKANLKDLGATIDSYLVGPLNRATEKLNEFLKRLNTNLANGVPTPGIPADITRMSNADLRAALGQAGIISDISNQGPGGLYSVGALFKDGDAYLKANQAQIAAIAAQRAYWEKALADFRAAHPDGNGPIRVTMHALPGSKEAGEILPLSTGDRLADTIVDNCSKWLRVALQNKHPEIAAAIRSLFGGSADATKANLQNAGLLKPFTGLNDLRPGDVVVYDKNHVGTYVGDGMVRGNNRVTYAANGGQFGPGGINNGAPVGPAVNPVGDVYYSSLGTVVGYARPSEWPGYRVAAPPASQGAPKPPPSNTPPPDPNAALKAQIAEGKHLIKQYVLAVQSGNDVWIAKAKAAVDDFRKSNKVAWGGIADDWAAAQKSLKAVSGQYVASAEELKKYGSAAYAVVKEVAEAEKSGDADRIRRAQQRQADFEAQGKGAKAVLQLEQQVYRTRQQQATEADRKEEEARKKSEAAQKEAAQKSAQIAQQARAGRIADARQSLSELEGLRQRDMQQAGQTAAEQAAVELSYADRVFSARKAIADAEQAAAKREAENGPAQLRTAALARAEKAHTIAVQEAENERNGVRRKAADIAAQTAQELDDRVAKALANLNPADAADHFTRLKEGLQQAAKPNPDPAKYAAELSQRLQDLRGELADPQVAADFEAALRALAQQGGITDAQLQTLLATLKDFQAAPLPQSLLPDNLQGRGEGATISPTGSLSLDDAANGSVPQGSEEALYNAALAMDPERVGAMLGDLISKGMEDSALANVLRRALLDHGITAEDVRAAMDAVSNPDAYADGSRGLSARTSGATLEEQARTFEDLQQRIFDLQDTLSDPAAASAFEEALKLTAQQGNITDAQLAQLLSTLNQLNPALERVNTSDIYANPDSYADGGRGLTPRPAGPTPEEQRQNFEDLAAQLQANADELRTNSQLADDFAQALQDTAAQGNISASQLKDLNLILDSLRSSLSTPPSNPLEDELNKTLSGLQESKDALDAGTLSWEDYGRAQLAGAQHLEDIAKNLERLGQVDAAKSVWALADAARASVPQLTAFQSRVNDVATFLQNYGQQAVNIFGLVGSAMAGLDQQAADVAAGWASDLGDMTNDLIQFGKDIASGNWFQLAIDVITSIFTHFAKEAQRAREELKKTQDYNNQFRFGKDDGYGTRKVTTYVTGILWWSTTHYAEKIDEAAKKTALALEDAIATGVSNGFQAALDSGHFTDFAKEFRKSMADAVKKGVIDDFLNDGEVGGKYKAGIQKYLDAKTPEEKAAARQELIDLDKQNTAKARKTFRDLDDLDRATGQGRYSPEAIAQREHEALDRQHEYGLVSTQEYNRRRLQIDLDRIEKQRQEELAIADLTAEERAEINARYDQQVQDARLKDAHELLNTYAQSAYSGLESALEQQDFSKFGDNLKREIFKSTVQGLLQGLESDIIKQVLSPITARIADDIRNGVSLASGEGLADLQALKSGIITVTDQTKPIFEAFAPLFREFGFNTEALDKNTSATKENTEATREAQFQQTTIVDLGLRPGLDQRGLFAGL